MGSTPMGGSMDYELVSETLYNMMYSCFHHAMHRPDDPCSGIVVETLDGVPDPQEALDMDNDARELAESYYSTMMQLRTMVMPASESWVRGFVLGMTERLDRLAELGIIDDMPVTKTPQPEPQAETLEAVENELRVWRIESFRDELKFTQREAEALADAMTPSWVKVRNGDIKLFEAPLAYSRVKKMLEEGCNHKLIVSILT